MLGSPINVYPAQKVWDGKTVEVHGLSPSTSPDALELFFDDKRRSVEVDYIQMDTGKDVAYVTFLNIDGLYRREIPKPVNRGENMTVYLPGVQMERVA